jgi:predicted ATPase
LAYLREKRMLLVLDNVEHLPNIADVAAMLLQKAPNLNLLVTSRERLALREERLFTVEGLTLEPSQASGNLPEAIQLFVQSVQRLQRQFRPTAVDWPAIFAICRLVEGMPLAVELAAAWVPERGCTAVGAGYDAADVLFA